MDPGEIVLPVWIIPYASTQAGMALLALVCWRWKGAGRALFVLLFLGAAIVNAVTASARPSDYLSFADSAWSETYREFILGFFSRHIPVIVGLIAAGQFAIALLVAGRGRAVRLGLAGAMVFLIAIAPLGIGSAFPGTLVAALAAALLWKPGFARPLPDAWLHRRDRARLRRQALPSSPA